MFTCAEKRGLSPGIISFSVSNLWNVCESLSTPLRFLLISLSLPPPPLAPPELDNENNEFGVCFFLRVPPSPTSLSLFISPGPYLSHRDPRVTLSSTPQPPPTLLFFFCLPLVFCRFSPHSLCSDITTAPFYPFSCVQSLLLSPLPLSLPLSPRLSV